MAVIKTDRKTYQNKPKHIPKPNSKLQELPIKCVHNNCAQVSYTIQHRTVLTIFPLVHQTIIIVQMFSTGGEGELRLQLK